MRTTKSNIRIPTPGSSELKTTKVNATMGVGRKDAPSILQQTEEFLKAMDVQEIARRLSILILNMNVVDRAVLTKTIAGGLSEYSLDTESNELIVTNVASNLMLVAKGLCKTPTSHDLSKEISDVFRRKSLVDLFDTLWFYIFGYRKVHRMRSFNERMLLKGLMNPSLYAFGGDDGVIDLSFVQSLAKYDSYNLLEYMFDPRRFPTDAEYQYYFSRTSEKDRLSLNVPEFWGRCNVDILLLQDLCELYSSIILRFNDIVYDSTLLDNALKDGSIVLFS